MDARRFAFERTGGSRIQVRVAAGDDPPHNVVVRTGPWFGCPAGSGDTQTTDPDGRPREPPEQTRPAEFAVFVGLCPTKTGSKAGRVCVGGVLQGTVLG